MTGTDIAQLRLLRQQILQSQFREPAEVVAWHGAMQAQDFAYSKWAVGLRLPEATDESVERALDAGSIIRTHLMRPTWHLVAAPDLRWMLALTAPQIKPLLASFDQKLGLDKALVQRSNALLAQVLAGGQQLTRSELMTALKGAGIPTDDLRSNLLMMHAELDGVVCNGARRGKQFTYALLDERVPASNEPFDRSEAIARLARRYFSSHGPASLADFVWWSGLKVSDARAGLESLQPDFTSIQLGKQTYWWPADAAMPNKPFNSLHLLAAFDEFMVSYKDRSASLDPAFSQQAILANGIFKPIIVVNGLVKGTWSRKIKKNTVEIEKTLLEPLLPEEQMAFMAEAERFGRFLGQKVTVL